MDVLQGGGSPLLTNYHMFTMVISISLLGTVLSCLKMGSIGAILWYIYAPSVMRIRHVEIETIWKVIPSIFLLLGLGEIMPLAVVLIMSADVKPKSDLGIWLRKVGHKLEDHSWSFMVGSNNDSPVLQLIRETYETLQNIVKAVTGEQQLILRPQIVATYLRTNDLAMNIQDDAIAQPMPPNEVLDMEKTNVNRTRVVMASVFIIVMVVTLNTKLGVLCLVLAIAHAIMGDKEDVLSFDTHDGLIAAGIYRLEKRWLIWVFSRSIGVAYDGTMHGCYHATQLNDLVIGNRVYSPSFASVHADLVTWAGFPKMVMPNADDVIFVNRENDEGRFTKAATICIDGSLRSFSWIGDTVPGESGSPVWARRDGKLLLVGLAGRWGRIDNETTEISVAPIMVGSADDEGSGVRKIIMAPGSGKTRNEIPRLVMDSIVSKIPGKIFVLGPTRIVAMEIYNSLKAHYTHVGLSIKGQSNLRNIRAQIQVSTHTSFMRMVVKGSAEVANVGTLIIDEAHFDTTGTYMAREYAKFMANNGKRAYELSATLDGFCKSESNYPITDHKIKEEDQLEKVKELVGLGKRVLWFVHGSEGARGAKALAETLNKAEIVSLALSRATFSGVYARLNDENVRVVVSTNIAECGLNINCDAVVDCGKEYGYFTNDGFTEALLVGTTEASRTQRRGRVGRRKAGEYYFVECERRVAGMPANEYDAMILCSGRPWNVTQFDTEVLSDDQVNICLEKDMSPLYVRLTTDSRGRPLKGDNLRRSITSWTRSENIWTHCGACTGKFEWFDNRHHDQLVALLTDGSQPNRQESLF